MWQKVMTSLLVVLIAPMVLAQSAVPGPEDNVAYRPVLLFNHHLYRGLMSRPSAVAVDFERREIWVAETGSNVIGVYRPDGIELFSFTDRELIREPSAIALTPDGDLAVIAGRRDRVRIFSFRGEYKGDLELNGIEAPSIGAVAWDRSGRLHIGDNASAQVFVYEPSGRLRLQFGSRGLDEGQFTVIKAIAIGSDGSIYVLDQRAIAVQVFDSQGNYLRGWGKHTLGQGNFSLPSGIAVDSKDRVIVADQLRHVVYVFRNDGTLLSGVGGFGPGIGQLSFPTDVAVDGDDRILVTEKQTSRVQVFAQVPVGQ